jgi:nucleotide-binding universal stress UspA family protein
MKTILVPVDYSSNSDKACSYAIALAKDLKAKIILMHAFESTVLFSKLPLMTVQMDYAYLYNNAANKLKTYYKKIRKSAGKVEIELNIQPGLPSARITELAIDKKADLIIMGTTGKGAVVRAMMGSNTTRTIRTAPCMILAIPPKATYHAFKKIVYATDLSNDNLKHAQSILPLAKEFGSEISFLNVGSSDHTVSENELKTIKEKIKSVVHYSKISAHVASDDNITSGIDNFLKYNKADCLAVYTHYRSLLSNMFNKSIAKSLAIHTTIPLLIIHEHDFEESKVAGKKQMAILTVV